MERLDSKTLQELCSTRAGASIFKAEGLNQQFEAFKEDVKKRLHDAEMEHFTEETVSDFKQAMRTQTRMLMGTGHMPWTKKKNYMVQFLLEDTPMEYTSLTDHWTYPLEARLRTLAVHMCKVERLPWEKVVFGETDPIPGLPMAVRIDDSLLVDCQNARRAMNHIFGRFRADTFADMIEIVRNHCGHVKDDYDKYVKIECKYLTNVIEKATATRARDEVISLFPTPESDPMGDPVNEPMEGKIVATVKAIKDLWKSPRVNACSVTLADDIGTVHTLVSNISKGAQCATIDTARMGEWHAKVMSQAEVFCSHASVDSDGQPIVLYGRKALAQKWAEYGAKTGRDKQEVTKCLRTFQWMLTPDQKLEVQKVVNLTIQNERARFFTKTAIGDDVKTASKGKPRGESSASSASGAAAAPSQSSLMVLQALKQPAPAPAAAAGKKHKKDDKESQRDLLLSLLKKQRTATA